MALNALILIIVTVRKSVGLKGLKCLSLPTCCSIREVFVPVFRFLRLTKLTVVVVRHQLLVDIVGGGERWPSPEELGCFGGWLTTKQRCAGQQTRAAAHWQHPLDSVPHLGRRTAVHTATTFLSYRNKVCCRWLHSAPRLKRDTCILPIGGRGLNEQILHVQCQVIELFPLSLMVTL